MNSKINLLKTIAIMLVVSGHLNFTLIHSLPTYAFHVALFFFISGMLFNNKYDVKTYFLKKFKTLMFPYILYCMIYIFITFAIYYFTGKFWGMPITLYNECIVPFLTGHQLLLCCPLWFVPQLFITLTLYKLFENKIKFNSLFYLILALIAIILSEQNNNLYLLLVYRTFFSLFFVHIGHLYFAKQIEKTICSIKYLIIFIPLLCCIFLRKYIPHLNVQGILNYSFCYMNFNKLWLPILPIISSLSGIYIILLIEKFIYKFTELLNLTKVINIIGQNTYHIMANHLLVFNVLTYILLKINSIPYDVKNTAGIYWVYSLETLRYFYFLLGIIVPIIGYYLIKKLRNFIYNLALKRLNKDLS